MPGQTRAPLPKQRSVPVTVAEDVLHSIFQIVTVSRDSDHCCCVWNTKDGKKHTDVRWPGKTEEYRFRACR